MTTLTVPIKCKKLGTQYMTIDKDDFEKIEKLNLTINVTSNPNTMYAQSTVYRNCKYVKRISIHRLVMGLGDYKDDKRIVHHKDHNGLNNCKDNLEICDTMYNSQACRHVCKDKYKHYSFENDPKRKCKWRCMITMYGKRTSKRFKTEEECKNFLSNISNASVNPASKAYKIDKEHLK